MTVITVDVSNDSDDSGYSDDSDDKDDSGGSDDSDDMDDRDVSDDSDASDDSGWQCGDDSDDRDVSDDSDDSDAMPLMTGYSSINSRKNWFVQCLVIQNNDIPDSLEWRHSRQSYFRTGFPYSEK